MVSHDGGDFLPRTLAALAAQTRPADTCIGVDTGSRDNSAALLEQALDMPETGEAPSKLEVAGPVMLGGEHKRLADVVEIGRYRTDASS